MLQFVDALKRGSEAEVRQLLHPDAFIGDFMQKKSTNLDQFAGYAKECPLSEVKLVSGRNGVRMPVGVEWYCPFPEYERRASFWFAGERISRIGWGKPMVIRTPSLKSR